MSDLQVVYPLLAQVENKVGRLYGDGVYDNWNLYATLSSRYYLYYSNKDAVIKQHGNSKLQPLARDIAFAISQVWLQELEAASGLSSSFVGGVGDVSIESDFL